MSNNKVFWRAWLEGRRSGAASNGSADEVLERVEDLDVLDLGLEPLVSPEKGKRILFRKRPQTFGERLVTALRMV